MPGTPLSEDKRNHSSAGAEGNSFNSRLRKISEALEKICENVGSLTLNGGDFLSQLTALIRPAGGQG